MAKYRVLKQCGWKASEHSPAEYQGVAFNGRAGDTLDGALLPPEVLNVLAAQENVIEIPEPVVEQPATVA